MCPSQFNLTHESKQDCINYENLDKNGKHKFGLCMCGRHRFAFVLVAYVYQYCLYLYRIKKGDQKGDLYPLKEGKKEKLDIQARIAGTCLQLISGQTVFSPFKN